MAQESADDRSFRGLGETVEAGRRRAGEYRLAHSFKQAITEAGGVEAEEQDARSWPSVRGLVRVEIGLDPGLDLTSDDRRCEAGHGLGRRACPGRSAGRD